MESTLHDTTGVVAAPIAHPSTSRPGRVWAHLRFVRDALVLNFQIGLEYRATFISQIFGMLANDIMWIVFWVLYFQRFPVIPGWGVEDVMMLWAVTGAGFGFAVGLFGNSNQLARIIAGGELDYYLALPKNVLLHVLVSRMDLAALGDILFGWGLFIVFLHPTPERIVLFGLMAVCSAAVMVGFLVAVGSLAFWLGNAEGLTMQLFNGIITMSTYPSPLFQGAVKVIMFTVVPAWFIAHQPVLVLRHFDLGGLALEVGSAALILAAGVAIFYRGLRRYESGNLMVLRA
jgi:ABC-2 type transport system permease protein